MSETLAFTIAFTQEMAAYKRGDPNASSVWYAYQQVLLKGDSCPEHSKKIASLLFAQKESGTLVPPEVKTALLAKTMRAKGLGGPPTPSVRTSWEQLIGGVL